MRGLELLYMEHSEKLDGPLRLKNRRNEDDDEEVVFRLRRKDIRKNKFRQEKQKELKDAFEQRLQKELRKRERNRNTEEEGSTSFEESSPSSV